MFKKEKQINASLLSCTNHFLFLFLRIFKREIRNELIDMLSSTDQYLYKTFFLLLPLQLCELVKFYVFKTSYDFFLVEIQIFLGKKESGLFLDILCLFRKKTVRFTYLFLTQLRFKINNIFYLYLILH